MKSAIPTAEVVRGWLKPLTTSQLEKLASLSGVHFGTLMKLRRGEIKNPGIETVRKFEPHIKGLAA